MFLLIFSLHCLAFKPYTFMVYAQSCPLVAIRNLGYTFNSNEPANLDNQQVT